ncbi:MAG: hypothetical protein KC621_25780 [Myxococcales bacterium]|nr:hypothetical protein [Myxococcales bacterium]
MPDPKPQPPTDRPADRPEPTPPPRPVFRRPVVRRLGALPAVTTAFGGSFGP